MEDLVLFKLHPEASNAEEGVDSDHYTTPPEWPDATSLNDGVSSHTITDHSIEIRMERPESPLSSIGHLGLVRGQRNALRAELRSHEEAAVQAKQSISSLRKLALRLAVRISVKEARISTHARLLAQARMEKYLAERNSPHTLVPGHVRQESYPLSPPQSPEPGKPLPALPRWDSSGRVTTVRFSPVDQHSPSLTELQRNHSYSARHNLDSTDQSQYGLGIFENQQLEKIDASRASLVKELEATQARLAKLFESQAILRERYNNEREKARTLDAECQEIHAKVSTLEQSKHEVEEDAQHLHQRIEDLEQGNSRLKGELETAKAERSNIQEDLSKLQSSKLTLEHQLQAATASKDTWETQLQSLHLSSNKLEQELEEKMIEIKEGTEKSDNTISLLEAERQKLDDDLKVTKFRLSAAVGT
jgi:DNA repair exonuclease SbcCD ATPase subunit